jgi:hypothetical protein
MVPLFVLFSVQYLGLVEQPDDIDLEAAGSRKKDGCLRSGGIFPTCLHCDHFEIGVLEMAGEAA